MNKSRGHKEEPMLSGAVSLQRNLPVRLKLIENKGIREEMSLRKSMGASFCCCESGQGDCTLFYKCPQLVQALSGGGGWGSGGDITSDSCFQKTILAAT